MGRMVVKASVLYDGRNRGREGGVINTCEEKGAKNFKHPVHGLLERDRERLPKADLSAPNSYLLSAH